MRYPLSSTDISFLHLDSDTSKQVVALFCELDCVPNETALRTRLVENLVKYPKLVCRLDMSKSPSWTESNDFDLNDHLTFQDNPYPSTTEHLSSEFSKGVDLNKPPWRIIISKNSAGK